MPFCLYCLVEFTALVHFIFYKNKKGRFGYPAADIICQVIPSAFKESGILKYDQPALCKKGQSLRQIDHFFDICLLPFIVRIIHSVPFGNHGFDEPFLILLLQVSLLTVQKIDLFKLSCF